MIIVIGGIKGGSGKTTIATNLAVMRATSKKVLLVDADEQKSAWYWSRQRESMATITKNERVAFPTVCWSGKEVYDNLIKMRKKYDDIIIDTGGRDTTSQRAALSAADKFLIPFKPSSVDIWTLSLVRTILDECLNKKLKAYSVISQADFIGTDNYEALKILEETLNIEAIQQTIGNRKVFRNATAEGLGITEFTPNDKKARQEMKSLFDLIYS